MLAQYEDVQLSLSLKLTVPNLVILYTPILIVSYMAAVFHPPFTFIFLILVPAAADFILGFLTAEPDKAAKTIIACFLLHALVALGLLAFYPAFSEALVDWWRYVSIVTRLVSPLVDPFVMTVIIIAGYPILHIVFGIPISFAGIAIRFHLSSK